MTRQEQDDVTLVLTVLMETATPPQTDRLISEGMLESEEQLDEAMKRLGDEVGLVSGIL